MISITKDILKILLVLDSEPLSVLVLWHLVIRIRQAKCFQFQLCYHPLSGCPHSGRTPGAGPEGPHYGAAVRYLPHTTSSSGIARSDCNNAKSIAFTGKNPRRKFVPNVIFSRRRSTESPALSMGSHSASASATSSLNRLASSPGPSNRWDNRRGNCEECRLGHL